MQTNYSQQSDYELVNQNQDIRGWPVKDQAGATLGTVREMVVDTDKERVTQLLLDNGRAVPAKDVILADHVVLFGARRTGTNGTAKGTEQVLPVVEEFLKVGKRTVNAGGVRVQTEVTARPVEETVRLREEHVSVERRPVNRPVDPAAAAQLHGQSIEMTATAEEVVVAKTARVVEEIVLRKDVTEHNETVRDTVKHTEVRVENDTLDHYRSHFDSRYATSGMAYEQMLPAYRFGHKMRTDSRFRGNSWSQVEPNARAAWEERNPGTWERFKEAVEHAWTKVTGS